MAKQRMKTEAALGIVGGITIAIVAKKAATRIGQDYCDKVIKCGNKDNAISLKAAVCPWNNSAT